MSATSSWTPEPEPDPIDLRENALLRPMEVARQMSVSRAWVYEAARTGRIPSVRLGGDDGPLRFIAADVDRWLAQSRAGWLPGRRT